MPRFCLACARSARRRVWRPPAPRRAHHPAHPQAKARPPGPSASHLLRQHFHGGPDRELPSAGRRRGPRLPAVGCWCRRRRRRGNCCEAKRSVDNVVLLLPDSETPKHRCRGLLVPGAAAAGGCDVAVTQHAARPPLLQEKPVWGHVTASLAGPGSLGLCTGAGQLRHRGAPEPTSVPARCLPRAPNLRKPACRQLDYAMGAFTSGKHMNWGLGLVSATRAPGLGAPRCAPPPHGAARAPCTHECTHARACACGMRAVRSAPPL
jgi:hypothetical protein